MGNNIYHDLRLALKDFVHSHDLSGLHMHDLKVAMFDFARGFTRGYSVQYDMVYDIVDRIYFDTWQEIIDNE